MNRFNNGTTLLASYGCAPTEQQEQYYWEEYRPVPVHFDPPDGAKLTVSGLVTIPESELKRLLEEKQELQDKVLQLEKVISSIRAFLVARET